MQGNYLGIEKRLLRKLSSFDFLLTISRCRLISHWSRRCYLYTNYKSCLGNIPGKYDLMHIGPGVSQWNRFGCTCMKLDLFISDLLIGLSCSVTCLERQHLV